MSKLLRDLLDATEPTFSLSLKSLEQLSGHHSVDNSLSAEILEKTHAAIRGLGLDINDTTDRELYHALEGKVRDHNVHLASSLGTSEDAAVKDIVPKLVEAVRQSDVPMRCWVLKKSVAKELLRQMPPKVMMKNLGYRSLESMYKNENFSEIYAGLRFSEGPEWLNSYDELFEKSVQPSDFEIRDIEIVVMDHKKWVDMAAGFVKKKLHNVTHTKELGVIIVVPMEQTHMRGLTLKTLPLLFHYINEIRLYSAFFKLKSTAPHFGKTISDTLIADVSTGAVIAGHNIHWRVIQRYLGRHKEDREAEAFEPHVQPEDLHWRKAEESLFRIDNELKFWQDMDYVARIAEDGDPVAFNLFDVSFGFSNQESFQSRYFYHMRESLWNEIFIRYMGKGTLKQQILEQLDNDMIRPERLV
ncbi:hypothetical protein KBD20_02495 [Candidatus Saccharibacteria bacterium]|nr:hypothetical protein [Candidatus Saccharibacteria bacterium]